MITPKIQNLFHFIEFLHSNIENFNRYEKEINELYLLDKDRQKLNPNKNFAEKLEYDKIQLQIKDKHKVIQDNIIQPIKDKTNELNICNPDESPTLWNYNISEILELKENFESEDLPVIFSHKNKYLEYRTKTKGEAFFGLGFFFDDLDQVLKELFNYFNETEQNEFEAFETKAVRVNYITEAVELLKQGHKVTLPLNFLDLPKEPQQNNTETQNSNAEPQQSHVEPPKTQKDTKQQPKTKSPFSVMEWATIYYYADTAKLLPENRFIEEGMKEFMKKHKLTTTFPTFKNKVSEAKKRINAKTDYPINKLKNIIPFLKANYKQAVIKVENDIYYLKDNKPDN